MESSVGGRMVDVGVVLSDCVSSGKDTAGFPSLLSLNVSLFLLLSLGLST